MNDGLKLSDLCTHEKKENMRENEKWTTKTIESKKKCRRMDEKKAAKKKKS